MHSQKPGYRRSTIATLVLAGLLTCGASAGFAGSGVHGRVRGLDESGELIGSVAGAAIEFQDQAGRTVGRTSSTSSGYYRLDLSPGRYFYRVEADGYRTEDQGRGIDLHLVDGYAVYNLSLTRGETPPGEATPERPKPFVGRLAGTVRGVNGEGAAVPIPQGRITLHREGTRELRQVIFPNAGEDGAPYEITLPEGQWKASVSAEGFETLIDPQPIQITEGIDARRDFTLVREEQEEPSGQGIRGTISTVEPVETTVPPEISLRIVPLNNPAETIGPDDPRPPGSYAYDLPPGLYRVIAESPGYLAATSPRVVVFEGRHTVVNLRLQRSEESTQHAVRVTVREKLTGGMQALPGARVVLRKPDEDVESAKQGVTDEMGEVLLLVESAGRYVAMARMKGFSPAARQFSVGPSDPNQAELILTRMGEDESEQPVAVTGRVAYKHADSSKGFPGIPGTQLAWRPDDGQETLQTVEAGQDGGYQVELPPATYVVDVQPPAGFVPLRALVKVERGMKPRDFILDIQPDEGEQKQVVVSGYVMYEDQKSSTGYFGISGARLSWRTESGTRPVATGVSAERGSYRVRLPEGTYTVDVQPPPEYRPLRVRVTVREGMKPRNFILDRRDQVHDAVEVSGYVVSEQTATKEFVGVPRARLRWKTRDTAGETETDSRGRFASQLRPGRYELSIEAAGYHPLATRMQVEPGMKPVRFVLRRIEDEDRQLALNLRILERVRIGRRLTFKPVPGAEIVISTKGEQAEVGQVDRSGLYATRLKPGQFEILVHREGFRAAREKVILSTRNRSLDILLTRIPAEDEQQQATLTLRVVERTGSPGVTKPIPQVPPVQPFDPSQPRSSGNTESDSQESRIDQLRSRFRQRLEARQPSAKLLQSRVKTIAGAAITITRMGRPVSAGETDDSGIYRAQLDPGIYRVQVTHRNYETVEQRVTILKRDVSRQIVMVRKPF